MLSVEAFNRELNKAVRDFFFVPEDPGSVVASGGWDLSTTTPGLPEVAFPFGVDPSLSSSSRRAFEGLKDKTRRRRPLRPPRPPGTVVEGSIILAKSLSSRDIRFSAAVKLPWDNGEGLAGRGRAVDGAWVAVDVVTMDDELALTMEVELTLGRAVVEEFEDADAVR
jgi:hypothetical protein